MKFKLYALLATLFFLQAKSFAAITLTIISPSANQPVTDYATISVAFTSPYNLLSVNAAILTAQKSLSRRGDYYEGTISLAGLPYDTLMLTVVAEDILHNRDSASVKFFHKKFDSLPVFTAINYPTLIKNVYMPVHAEAHDAEGDVYLNLLGQEYSPLGAGLNVIDTTTDVSNLLGSYQTKMLLLGRDTANHVITNDLPFAYEPSPYLETYFDKPVADFNYNKVLQVNGSDFIYKNLSNGDTALLRGDSGKAYLSPDSYFYFKKVVSSIGTVYTKDTAYKFWFNPGDYRLAYNEVVNGNQFVFGETSPGAYTVHVNTETKVIDTLGVTDGYDSTITQQNVDSAGNVVFLQAYQAEGYFVKDVLYKIGNTTTRYDFTAAPFDPVIKGNRILYTERNWYYDGDGYLQFRGPVELKLIDASKGNTSVKIDVLAGVDAAFVDPSSYKLNDIYFAYTKYNDTTAYKTFYLVDTAGNKTGFNEDSSWNNNNLIALNETGEMIFSSPTHGLTFMDKNGHKTAITRLTYNARWYNGNWYLYSDNGLYGGVYKLNLSRGGVLSNIVKAVKKDSSYTFTKKDYDNASAGIGLAYDVKITMLPKYGKMYFNNRLLVKDTVIRHASLDSIKYVPGALFTGNDTAHFNVSNYLSFAASDALIVFSIVEALPTQLTTFTGENKGTANQLMWQTAQEVNTAYFQLQHSTNANRTFVPLAQVSAAGNSNTVQSYNYTHTNPAAGANYYRLKMVDKDGKFTYSRIISILNGDDNFKAVVLPNPVHNNITLQLTSSTAQKVQVSVISINGKVLLSQQLTVNAGTSTKTIAAGSLAKGTYFIKVTSTGLAQAGLKIIKE